MRHHSVSALREALPLCDGRAVFFAITTKSGRLTLEQGNHPFLSLELSLICELASLGYAADVQLSAADERPAPFFEAMYDAVSLALLGCADGTRRTSLAPTVTYTFPQKDRSPETCGRDLEAILGVYRAWIELCVADRATVRFSDTADAPAWAMTQERRLPVRRVREDSQCFFVAFPVGEDGLPDFAACRTLCDTLTNLSKEGKILSCRRATDVCVDGAAAHAIVLESACPLPFPTLPAKSPKNGEREARADQ